MKLIKITYRNVFVQPIGILNPMNLTLPGPCPVEVFEAGSKWKIREIASPHRRVYEKLGEHVNARIAMERAEMSFACSPGTLTSPRSIAKGEVFNPWQMWGDPPHDIAAGRAPGDHARILDPAEVAIITKEGRERVYWREAEDYTHIIHAPTMDPKRKIPDAACGAQVKAECFINNRANVEPSCVKCAEVWREHYQEKRRA